MGRPAGAALPYKPLQLLIAYDDPAGRCADIVRRMKEMLEQRAFQVDVLALADGAEDPDLAPYAGVVLGCPVGTLRANGPSPRLVEWIGRQDGLDEKKVALFTVFTVRRGRVLEQLKDLVAEKGAECVVDYAYWALRPDAGEHLLPAECMVRIRQRP